VLTGRPSDFLKEERIHEEKDFASLSAAAAAATCVAMFYETCHDYWGIAEDIQKTWFCAGWLLTTHQTTVS